MMLIKGKTKPGRIVARFLGYRTMVHLDKEGKQDSFLMVRGNDSSIQIIIDSFIKDGWVEEKTYPSVYGKPEF